MLQKEIGAGVEQGLFTGAVVCVARHGDPLFLEAHGHAEVTPSRRPMTLETRFDLGQLTQVVATMTAVLRTIQMGKWSLVDPIVHTLPEFATGVDRFSKAQISVFHLLTHQSGLPAWRPYFLNARGTKAYLRAMADTPLDAAPGTKTIRSDLGYMLLGMALERIWDKPFAEICQRLVFVPLDMHQTVFAGEGLPAEWCAATEIGNEYERKRCAYRESGPFPWRGDTICGEVHDGNAYYGLDGVGGHAGLFSTAADLNRYAEMWVRKGVFQRERFLDNTLITLATARHPAGPTGGSGFGWEPAGVDSSIGTAACSGSYGAVGLTGASLWCDPLHKLTAVVLTNAAHPTVGEGMREWRETFHQLVFHR